jgi:thymidylate kinase
MKKIFVIEGLPASGKTTVADLLRDRFNFEKVNESLGHLDESAISDSQEKIFEETKEKYYLAQRSRKNSVIDRGYPSMLAWDYVAEKSKLARNFKEKKKWVATALKEHKLYEPDYYIYLNQTPEFSLINRPRKTIIEDVWSGSEGMKHCSDFYKLFFKNKKNVIYITSGHDKVNLLEKVEDELKKII